MTKQHADEGLEQKPLITFGILGQALGVGPAAAKSAAFRLGIEPRKMPNGRELLSFEQAQMVAAEMTRRTH